MAPTLRAIAEKTGYALSTVGNVLNGNPATRVSEDARHAITTAAQSMGYSPDFFARRLRHRRSFTIGVACSLFGAEIVGRQLRSLSAPLADKGYHLLFGDSSGEEEAERNIIRDMAHKQVEGLVLFARHDGHPLRQWIPQGTPALLISYEPVPGFPCLVIDLASAMENAVRRIAALGRRRIALLISSPESNAQKVRGYERAVKELGLWDPRLVWFCSRKDGTTQDYVEEQLRRTGDVDAVMAGNDRIALEVLSGMTRAGRRAPGDCAVVGFDDTEIALATHPRLTTVRQPQAEVGQTAARMMLDLLSGKDVRDVTLTPQLIERESSGSPRPGKA